MRNLHTACKAALLITALTGSACTRNPQRTSHDLLAEAHNYAQQGKWASAEIEARRALQLEPHSIPAYLELAQIELAQQHWTAAYAALRETVTLDPRQTGAELDLARLYLRNREFDSARQAAQQVLATKANDPDQGAAADQVLAAVAAATHQPSEALAEFQKVVELRPHDASAWINVALAEASAGHVAQAKADLENAITVDSHAALAYADTASLDLAQHDRAGAEAAIRQGLEGNPTSIDLWTAKAKLEYDPAHPEVAEQTIGTMLARQPSAEAAEAAGKFFADHGDWNRAIAVEEPALQLSPADVPVREHLLEAYFEADQWIKAQSMATALLKLDGENLAGRLGAERLRLHAGQTAQAITGLRQLAQEQPGNAAVLFTLAQAYQASGDLAEATQSAELAHAQAGQSAQILSLLARLSLAQGQLAAAQRYVDQLAALPSSSATGAGTEVERLAGQVALDSRQYARALAEWGKTDMAHSSQAQDHVLLAQAAAGAGQSALARSELERALQLQPDSSAIVGALVHLEVAQQDWNAAGQAIARFAAARPQDPAGPWLVGSLALARHQDQQARAAFTRALQLRPDFVEAKLDLGRLEQADGNTPRALYWFQQALAQEPNFAPLLTLIGNLHMQQQDWPAAAGYFRKALAVQPGFAYAAANLAWVDAEQNQDLNQALALAQQAAKAQPDAIAVQDTLAWVYYKLGSYPAALPILRHCTQADATSALYRFHLGMAEIATGQKSAGASSLRQALAMKLPADAATQAKLALQKLPASPTP